MTKKALFNAEDINSAITDFVANAATRTVAGAGYNKDITIFTMSRSVANGAIQTASDRGSESE